VLYVDACLLSLTRNRPRLVGKKGTKYQQHPHPALTLNSLLTLSPPLETRHLIPRRSVNPLGCPFPFLCVSCHRPIRVYLVPGSVLYLSVVLVTRDFGRCFCFTCSAVGGQLNAMYGLAGNGALLLTTASLLAWPVCAWAGGHPEALPASSSVSSVTGEHLLLYIASSL
jgi:hypothetical protein